MSAPTSGTVAGHGQTFLPRPGVTPRWITSEVARQTPLYAALVRRWTERDATVPGVADPEWQRLVSYHRLMEETETALAALRPHRAPDVLPSRKQVQVPAARSARLDT
ncbi:hypothetical protein SSP35_17_00610 [Streptomyces sp. NBRC 110611]|uniref:hypothetical protein n=1 Tax=Streptomyces sp. NBRC 110611 TaxID=1621259 RepID=UPI00082B39C8|nr:hypothetical protein [Streptomyces sp. NBRC 110611]GAU70206.1 hypothetical protein SSP35_17_00610 [Streptomyces sp. NBRC 110611]